MRFLRTQWNDIKGNAKWAALVVLWGLIVKAIEFLLRRIPNMPTWGIWLIIGFVSIAAFLWLARKGHVTQQPSAGVQPAAGPALAAAGEIFDIDQYLAQTYHSPLGEEVARRMRTAAERRYPNATERTDFYLKFIGEGVINYAYDVIWFSIYRSQLLCLNELNRKPLTLQEVRPFYDLAAQQHAQIYAKYSFDQWLGYMKLQVLTLQDGMVLNITQRGQDFLKSCVHWHRSPEDRNL